MNAARNIRTKASAEPASPTLADLIAVATKANPTVGDLHGALTAARDEVHAAQAAHDEADRSYRAGLLQLDEKALAATIQAKNGALIRRDRASALVETLESRVVEFEAFEAEKHRRTAYAAAQAAGRAAEKAIREVYPELAVRIRDLLRQVAEAEQAVAQANADLPAGAEHLSGPEDNVRSVAARPKVVIAETEVSLWCYETSWTPLSEEQQRRVRPSAGGMSYLPALGGAQGANGVVSHRFIRREFLPETPPRWADYLATEICLPGRHGLDENFWHPRWASRDPDHVIMRLDETEGTGAAFDGADDDRAAEVEFELISGEHSRTAA